MELVKYFKMGFQKYADFSTRSTRSEFWWFQLGYFLMFIPIFIVLGLLSFMFVDASGGDGLIGLTVIFGIVGIIVLATIIPQLAIAVRRLHDAGHTGWLYLLTVIPYIGTVAWIIFGVLETQQKTNKWGPVPGREKVDTLRDALLNFDEDNLV